MDIFLQIVPDQVRVEAGRNRGKHHYISCSFECGYVELSVPGNSMDGNRMFYDEFLAKAGDEYDTDCL